MVSILSVPFLLTILLVLCLVELVTHYKKTYNLVNKHFMNIYFVEFCNLYFWNILASILIAKNCPVCMLLYNLSFIYFYKTVQNSWMFQLYEKVILYEAFTFVLKSIVIHFSKGIYTFSLEQRFISVFYEQQLVKLNQDYALSLMM